MLSIFNILYLLKGNAPPKADGHMFFQITVWLRGWSTVKFQVVSFVVYWPLNAPACCLSLIFFINCLQGSGRSDPGVTLTLIQREKKEKEASRRTDNSVLQFKKIESKVIIYWGVWCPCAAALEKPWKAAATFLAHTNVRRDSQRVSVKSCSACWTAVFDLQPSHRVSAESAIYQTCALQSLNNTWIMTSLPALCTRKTTYSHTHTLSHAHTHIHRGSEVSATGQVNILTSVIKSKIHLNKKT